MSARSVGVGAVLSALLALVGCNGSDSGASAPATTAASESTSVAPPSTAAPTTAGAEKPPEEEVAALRGAEAEALLAGDSAALDGLLSDDFVGVQPSGTVTKAEWLEQLSTGAQHYVSIEPGQARYGTYGEAVVVQANDTLVVDEAGQPEGGPGPVRVLEVWVRDGGRWVLAASGVNADPGVAYNGPTFTGPEGSVDATVRAGETPESTVRRLQPMLYDAMKNDAPALAALLTDDFLRVPPPAASTTTKAEWLGFLQANPGYYRTITADTEEYHAYQNAVVVATTGPVNDTPLRLLFVWVEADGRWSLAAVHGSVTV